MGTAGPGRPRAKRRVPHARRDGQTDERYEDRIRNGRWSIEVCQFRSPSPFCTKGDGETVCSWHLLERNSLPLQVSLLRRPSFSLHTPIVPSLFPLSPTPFDVVAPPSFFESSSFSLLRRAFAFPPFFLSSSSRSYVRRSPIFLSSSPSLPPNVRQGYTELLLDYQHTTDTGYHRARSPKERAAERVIRCLVELLRRHGQTEEQGPSIESSPSSRPTSSPLFSYHRAPSFAESSPSRRFTIVEARLWRARAISFDVPRREYSASEGSFR